jgi:hypothetical protein
MREKPAEFLGTGHQCKDDYSHQLSVIFESVETFIGIEVVPWGCTSNLCPCFKHLWLIYSLINHLMRVDTYSLNCIQFPL